MIDVPSNPEPPVDDLAGFVDSFRRPKDVPNRSSWLANPGVLPEALEKDLAAVARDFERPQNASFFRFRRPGTSLLVCNGAPSDEAAVIDHLAKRLDLRIFSYDMRDVRRLLAHEIDAMLAPLYDGRSAIVHLGRVDAMESGELEHILARRTGAALVIATAPNELSLDPAIARQFRRKVTF